MKYLKIPVEELMTVYDLAEDDIEFRKANFDNIEYETGIIDLLTSPIEHDNSSFKIGFAAINFILIDGKKINENELKAFIEKINIHLKDKFFRLKSDDGYIFRLNIHNAIV